MEGNGKRAIHIAASRGDLGIFKFLIEQGADYNIKDDLQNSPLFIAVEHQSKELVQYLLDDLHVNVNQDRNSITPLHQAAQLGNIGIIELLISHGAIVDAISKYGTPLICAAAQQQNWVCQLLLQKGADPNSKNEIMPPMLHLIIDQNNKTLFDVILAEFKDSLNLNITDQEGWSCLQLCAEKGRTDMLKSLIDLHTDVDYENQGQNALDLAVQHGNWECVEILRSRARRQELNIKPQVKELTQEEKQNILEQCIKLKDQANQQFKQSNFQDALNLYEQALIEGQQIQTHYTTDIIPIYTNIAQTYIKLKQPKKTLEICNKARQLDSKWIKIYFLEGLAYEDLQEYGEAAASYFDGMKIENSTLFKQMFDKAIQKGKEQHKQKLNQQK